MASISMNTTNPLGKVLTIKHHEYAVQQIPRETSKKNRTISQLTLI